MAGAYLAFSPLWVDVGTTATWALVIIGAAIAILALVALALPSVVIDEFVIAAGGVVAFIAPWLFSYTDTNAAAWGSWIAGAVVVAAGLLAVPASTEAHRLRRREQVA